MPSKRMTMALKPAIGWSTDAPLLSRELSHWILAENVTYESSGSLRKFGGTTRLNSTAIAANPTVLGIFDYWRAGTAGAFTGKAIAHASTNLWKMDRGGSGLDGTWDSITGALTLTSGAFPHYTVFTDLVIMTTDAATPDAPHRWDGVGAAGVALGGTPPVARLCATHVNRAWLANTNANPSRLTYSALLGPETWTGADSGSLDIDPEDGDVITAIVSHYNRLFVFKGPNTGSIHVITGTSPTGADAFARRVVMRGIPCATQRAVVQVGNDLWFLGAKGIHTVANTEQFGDHSASFASRDIQTYWTNNVNLSRLNQAVGAHYPQRNLVVFSIPGIGQTNNDTTLLFHLNHQNRVSRLTRGAASLAVFQGANQERLLHAGRYSNGFVDREDAAARSLVGTTAYTARVQTPLLSPTPGDSRFNIREAWIRTRARGGDITMGVRRDGGSSQSITFAPGAGGGLLDIDILDAFQLGSYWGATNRQVIEGPARSVALEISQGNFNGDMEVYEFGLELDAIDSKMES